MFYQIKWLGGYEEIYQWLRGYEAIVTAYNKEEALLNAGVTNKNSVEVKELNLPNEGWELVNTFNIGKRNVVKEYTHPELSGVIKNVVNDNFVDYHLEKQFSTYKGLSFVLWMEVLKVLNVLNPLRIRKW